MAYKTIALRRQKMRDYYHRTKPARRLYQERYAAFRRRLVYDLKNKPCTDCLGWFEPCQMEFDHLPGFAKKFIMGNTLTRSIKAILFEAKKCEVVCSNCHKLRTYRRAYDSHIRLAGGITNHIVSTVSSSNTQRVP